MALSFSSGLGRGTSRSFGPQDEINSRTRLILRLLIGLIQGLSAYALYEATKFDSIDSGLLVTWALLTGYAPPVLLAALGQMRLRPTLIWGGIVVAIITALGFSSSLLPDREVTFLIIAICLPAALFCAHHLVIPSINYRSLIAPYEAYYETAWKAGIQLVLALMFLGVFWLIMLLGALLFNAIGITLVEEIVTDEMFIFIASGILFALGVELSDVRDSLTQGIRTVALTLLSWLLPIAVFIAGAFIITLPLAGLSELHTSLSPAGLMLAASAGLIILLNTVYQDGNAHLSGSHFLRITLRVGIALLLPMTAFALWAVSVRVGQHGLTLPRIVALTASIIGVLYAIGYCLSQFVRPRSGSGWLPLYETTNIVVGAITAITLVCYSTPWLNPIRLSMENQFARVESGKLGPDNIPYSWLGWDSGPRGRALLEGLTKSSNPEIARRAKTALDNRYMSYDPAQDSPPFKLRMLPAGTAVPEGLTEGPRHLYSCRSVEGCAARLYDIDADGTPEVLILNANALWVMRQDENGTWNEVGSFRSRDQCGDGLVNEDLFASNDISTAPAQTINPVSVGDATLDYKPDVNCAVRAD